jgi:epsilon-lactone hydrolase
MSFILTHPLDREDAVTVSSMRAIAGSGRGKLRSISARAAFDAIMENVLPRSDVTFEAGTIGRVPGLWADPMRGREDAVILHLHGGWFNFGSARAFRHFVGHIAARAGARAFIPDYRLAPEHPFPAAVDDVMACYRGLDKSGVRRIAVTGDSAGGNLALVLASLASNERAAAKATLAGVVAFSPVTDLTLSGDSYRTRAEAEPYFTREQVAELVHAYLGDADPKHPMASPLYASLSALPPVRIHVGDDEVLLDDSRRYVERAVDAGLDARLDIWLGMAHGFPGSIGNLKAATLALDAAGIFLAERLRSPTSP